MTTKENQHYIARETILSMVHWFVEFLTGVSTIGRASSMNFETPASSFMQASRHKEREFQNFVEYEAF